MPIIVTIALFCSVYKYELQFDDGDPWPQRGDVPIKNRNRTRYEFS